MCIVPYVEQVRFDIGCETALVIIDNFKWQTTQAVIDLLELNNISSPLATEHYRCLTAYGFVCEQIS